MAGKNLKQGFFAGLGQADNADFHEQNPRICLEKS
jgi:hypothetical protein